MPVVTAKQNVKDATPPQRETLPPGWYHALIVQVKGGITKSTKVGPQALPTMEIEFQIVKTDAASLVNDEKDDKYAGRRVWQAYILAEIPTNPQWSQSEAFRIQQLLAATRIEHTIDPSSGAATFNTDHLTNKGVKINITQKPGTPKQPNDPIPMFNNVDRIDSAVEVADTSLV